VTVPVVIVTSRTGVESIAVRHREDEAQLEWLSGAPDAT
jgi:hypothetical protein